MKYEQAREIATRILKQLEPFCLKADVVGSVRREKSEVKDLEICLVARTTKITDLFGEVLEEKRTNEFCKAVRSLGLIVKGDVEKGRYVQIQLSEGIMFDLFMPIESDYERIKIIRTGCADYVKEVIAKAWLDQGWCGTENGLRKQKECYKSDLGNGKHKWICNAPNPTLPTVWENEFQYYQEMGIKWIEPKFRS